MSEFLEICMLISFGFSWPLNVLKSYRARTTKGKSLAFLCLIVAGYMCGIVSKLVAPTEPKLYVLFFYILNMTMVIADLLMYVRNDRLDKAAQASENK